MILTRLNLQATSSISPRGAEAEVSEPGTNYGKNVNVLLMSVRFWAAGTSAAQATARMGQLGSIGRIGRIGRVEVIVGIGIIQRSGGLSGGAGG